VALSAVYQQPFESQQECTEPQASPPISALAHCAWPDEPAELVPPLALVPLLPPAEKEPPLADEPLEPPLADEPPLPLEPPVPKHAEDELAQLPSPQQTPVSQ
jgi:hypothetical protein